MTEFAELAPRDWELLRDVRLAALLESPKALAGAYEAEAEWTEAQWRAKALEWQWFVALDGDEPVGVMNLASTDETHQALPIVLDPVPASLKCTGMWVAPERRGTGLAAQLLAAAARFGLDHGVEYMELAVFRSEHRAIAFYTRCGFVVRGSRTSVYRPERVQDMRAPMRALSFLRR